MAKRSCGAHSLHIELVRQQKGYARARRNIEAYSVLEERIATTGVLQIPTVFHIVYNCDENNVSTNRIHQQLQLLNDDFRAQNLDISNVPDVFKNLIADTEIEFVLPKRDPFGRPTAGITRTYTPTATFPLTAVPAEEQRSYYIQDELMTEDTGQVGWPRDRYMNVWVCDMDADPLGFATYPGTVEWEDGIVIDVKAFGISDDNDDQYNMGRTLVHEAGHWLNLIHLWGDNEAECSSTDNVIDTPLQKWENEGVPSFPSVSCNNGPNGDLFMNFLDYVDDQAMLMFTKGQKARMRAALIPPHLTYDIQPSQ